MNFASVQGKSPLSVTGPQFALAVPTGTIPRAKTASALFQSSVTTLSGFDLITVSPYACFIVIGNEAVAVELDEALLVEAELDAVDVLLSLASVDDDFAELVTLAVLDAAEFALSPFLAPQPVTKATASAIGITALNTFLILIISLSSHVLQRIQQLCIFPS